MATGPFQANQTVSIMHEMTVNVTAAPHKLSIIGTTAKQPGTTYKYNTERPLGWCTPTRNGCNPGKPQLLGTKP